MPNAISNLLFIVYKSLRQYALSTMIASFSVALAAGLLMTVFVIKTQTYNAFTGGAFGFDAVLGARGSQLQLVLNTVFHLETSPGNIPWTLYQAIKSDPRVTLAIPYAVGDNYHGFRIVGTSDELFTEFEYQRGKKFQVKTGGRFFDSTKREAVIGSFVAQKEGLKIGDTFHPFHGVTFAENMQHKEIYTVAGILKPTNSPSDKVVWIPIDGMFRMEGHVLRGTGDEYKVNEGEEIPDAHKEVSAVMLKLKSPQTGFQLDQTINKQGKVATLAWPIGSVMAELFNKIGWMNKVLAFIAYLVAIVASSSILASVYNTINERRREFAILRALGAQKRIVFSAIVLGCAAISGLGTLMGYGIFFMIMSISSVIVRSQTGVVLDIWQFNTILVITPIVMIVLGALAGILPAIKAYSTDVATNIVPAS